uniref:Uncharacterized protein AlNc14C442G11680 n=1 Tax=Albugo laibachii Nc14 TaxID=890382 RepID=F0WZT9_9STRA|nr:conserved hypothetical protein [Albugo laibachii Nc14]|eukprot:CCA27016.1 conserved hypothetical protein [Albugo laibachii Nc14]
MLRRFKRPRVNGNNTDIFAHYIDDITFFDDEVEISDVMNAIQLLHERYKRAFVLHRIIPLLYWHQIYAVLRNQTFVDQNIAKLRASHKLVTFSVRRGHRNAQSASVKVVPSSKFSGNDIILVPYEAYWSLVHQHLEEQQNALEIDPNSTQNQGKHQALLRFSLALPHMSEGSSLPVAAIVGAFQSISESASSTDSFQNDILWLRRLGFLLPTTSLHQEAYTLSIPNAGKFVTLMDKSRRQILSTLKRSRYHEILESQLASQLKLRYSHFPLAFHLADMEGARMIRRVKATSGTLVSLAQSH